MNGEPEMSIVTVKCTEKKIAADIELPASLSVRKAKAEILGILQNEYKDVFHDWSSSDCILVFNNRFLRDEAALTDSGVYEGSCLYLVKP